MQKTHLAVLIPMYNEERGAEKCAHTVMRALHSLSPETTLIVVNDGSKDQTKAILIKLAKEYTKQFVIVNHPQNKGYGAALATGINEAIKRHFTWILFMDSDLTNDPKYIKDFIKYTDSAYDCVKASRYIAGGSMVNVPLFRQIVSRTGNLIARVCFRIGVHDCTNGFRMVRLEKLKGITFKERSFSIILEELYYLKKKNARFFEIPNILTSRVDSASNFRYNGITFWNYLKYALKATVVAYNPN